jgi:2-succinyl-5-enolpyruvyl-6-hydroxy-3-cyclohexene-1-carboxylate synthase
LVSGSVVESAVEAARGLLAGAITAGLKWIVFAPGSRSAPLVYAALEAAARGEVELVVRTDERVAGFTALGLAAASGRPAAVVTTSGTAVANLHPAVMEAAASRWPLLAITADRPQELQGVGANQTTDQRGVFGRAPVREETLAAGLGVARCFRAGADAVAAAWGRASGIGGAVHINIRFREPLVPGPEWTLDGLEAGAVRVRGDQGDRVDPVRPAAAMAAEALAGRPDEMAAVELRPGPRTVVIAGTGAGPAARELAESAGWPLIAEPASGSWAGPNAITAGRLVARLLGERIERLVVYGRPVLSRPVTRLVLDPRIDTTVVHGGGGAWFDLGRGAGRIASHVNLSGPAAVEDQAWLEEWRQAGQVIWERLRDTPFPNGPAIAAAVVAANSGRIQGGEGEAGRGTASGDDLDGLDRLDGPNAGPMVVGASSAIRDLDLGPAPARASPIWSMRGLAGIDGTIGFAGGVALALGRSVTVLMGDLSLAHDAGALAIPELERRPDLRIVVLEDGGGAIFENLEVAAPNLAVAFDRFFATPLRLDTAALAQAYGAGHAAARTAGELTAALNRPVRGVNLLTVRLDRPERRGLEHRIVGLSRIALESPRKFTALREDSSRKTRFD